VRNLSPLPLEPLFAGAAGCCGLFLPLLLRTSSVSPPPSISPARRDEARSPAVWLVAEAGRARTAAEGGEGIGPDPDGGEEGERRPGPRRGGVSTAREESSPFLPGSPAISSIYPTRCGASRRAGGRSREGRERVR